MADIRPFRGLHLNPSVIPLEQVVAPPYDKVTPECHQHLLDATPLNAIRLARTKEGESYADGVALLEMFQREGAVQRDEEPCLYVLGQSFKDPFGRMKHRMGLVAACKLEEFRGGAVIPHLKTLPRWREDRFRHIQLTNMNVSPIMGLFHDRKGGIARLMDTSSSSLPFLEFTKGKVITRLWKVNDRETIKAFSTALDAIPLMIADGHHLYEAAMTYRDMMRLKYPGASDAEPWNFVLACFTPADDNAHTILPVHRVVNVPKGWEWDAFMLSLSKYFRVKPLDNEQQMMMALAKRIPRVFGMIGKAGAALIGPREDVPPRILLGDEIPVEVRDTDVTLLHAFILEKLLGLDWHAQQIPEFVRYAYTLEEGYRAIAEGEGDLAFLVNAPRFEQVMQVFRARAVLPAKSTCFHPYFPTGLLMRRLDEMMQ